jgi:hypothetical protein
MAHFHPAEVPRRPSGDAGMDVPTALLPTVGSGGDSGGGSSSGGGAGSSEALAVLDCQGCPDVHALVLLLAWLAQLCGAYARGM